MRPSLDLQIVVTLVALLGLVLLLNTLPRETVIAFFDAYRPETNSTDSIAGIGRILLLSAPFALLALLSAWSRRSYRPWFEWPGRAHAVLINVVLSALMLLYAHRGAPDGYQVLWTCVVIGSWVGYGIAWLIRRVA